MRNFWLFTAILAGSLAAVSSHAALISDFETAPGDLFIYNGTSNISLTYPVIADSDALARPGQTGDNKVAQADFEVTDFAGFGQSFDPFMDWSGATAISFWMYGFGSSITYQIDIFDNRSDVSIDTAERFDAIFVDDFTGWQKLILPFSSFTRATDFQPGGAPDDGFTLTEIWGYAFDLPVLNGAGQNTLIIDDIGLEVPSEVPAPSTLALFGLSLAGLGWSRRRSRGQAP